MKAFFPYYFSGHIQNPGINLVHPFSDIFSAIVQAGGVNDTGSLREIQLIRNDQIVSTIDFYSFFMNGKNTFSNIKLIDGDVIHIPNVKNRVSISGQVNRPSTYELLSGESVSDIITYASGFTSDASSSFILNQIIPVEERKKRSNILRSLSIRKKQFFYERQLGEIVDVLLENENKKGYITGYSNNYLRVKLPWNPYLINKKRKKKDN